MKKYEMFEDYIFVFLLYKGDEDVGIFIVDMFDDEMICGCNGVDKGIIVNVIIIKGLMFVDEVIKVIKVGNLCGKCKG